MPNKIVWLAAMFTLAYWLGSITGCASNKTENQNYRILEDDKPMFETKPNPSEPGATVPTPSSPSPATTPAPAVAGSPQATALVPQSETAPSLVGLDRSHWERLAIGPMSGHMLHSPYYFKDLTIQRPRTNDPLANADARGWDKSNSLAVVAQPAKFAADLVALPVHVITDPPRHWEVRTPLSYVAPKHN